MSDTYCELCGGSGEVITTPYGMSDKHAANYGCPICIQADRDKAEQQRDELLEALKLLVCQVDAGISADYSALQGSKIMRNARFAIAKAEG